MLVYKDARYLYLITRSWVFIPRKSYFGTPCLSIKNYWGCTMGRGKPSYDWDEVFVDSSSIIIPIEAYKNAFNLPI
jgi:hypothetical protein